jgi:hypothetical protein
VLCGKTVPSLSFESRCSEWTELELELEGEAARLSVPRVGVGVGIGGGGQDPCTSPFVEGYRGISGAKTHFCPRNALKIAMAFYLPDNNDQANKGRRTTNNGDGVRGHQFFFLDDGRAAGEGGHDGAQDEDTGIGGGGGVVQAGVRGAEGVLGDAGSDVPDVVVGGAGGQMRPPRSSFW